MTLVGTRRDFPCDMLSRTRLRSILQHWRLELKQQEHAPTIPGSPERTEYRTVVEDCNGNKWLLENITKDQQAHKLNIIHLLNQLNRAGYRHAVPYLATPGGHFQVESASTFWQIMPFIEGVSLDRPAYSFDRWRAVLLAKDLATLKAIVCSHPVSPPQPPFSLVQYIKHLATSVARYHPFLMPDLRPVLEFLETTYFPVHDELPVRCCHGDYHPLNIIWGEGDIDAIIDWEFSGIKTESYDLATLIGCLGMEAPDCLYGPLILELIGTLRANDYLKDKSWRYLLDTVLAIRFAWLSEWLRKKDVEMIEQELSYLYLLKDNYTDVKSKWALP